MKLPATTRLAKFNAFLACDAFILFIVAFATNYWLQKDFDFPVNAVDAPTIFVEASIGLFAACSVEHYPNNGSSQGCSPEGAAQWQYIAAGLDIVSLVFGLVSVILAIFGVLSHRLAENPRIKPITFVFLIITCGFGVAPLIIFPINAKIQVRPNLSPFQVDFDLSWSYIISAVSVGIYAILALFYAIDITCQLDDISHTADQEALSKNRSGDL